MNISTLTKNELEKITKDTDFFGSPSQFELDCMDELNLREKSSLNHLESSLSIDSDNFELSNSCQIEASEIRSWIVKTLGQSNFYYVRTANSCDISEKTRFDCLMIAEEMNANRYTYSESFIKMYSTDGYFHIDDVIEIVRTVQNKRDTAELIREQNQKVNDEINSIIDSIENGEHLEKQSSKLKSVDDTLQKTEMESITIDSETMAVIDEIEQFFNEQKLLAEIEAITKPNAEIVNKTTDITTTAENRESLNSCQTEQIDCSFYFSTYHRQNRIKSEPGANRSTAIDSMILTIHQIIELVINTISTPYQQSINTISGIASTTHDAITTGTETPSPVIRAVSQDVKTERSLDDITQLLSSIESGSTTEKQSPKLKSVDHRFQNMKLRFNVGNSEFRAVIDELELFFTYQKTKSKIEKCSDGDPMAKHKQFHIDDREFVKLYAKLSKAPKQLKRAAKSTLNNWAYDLMGESQDEVRRSMTIRSKGLPKKSIKYKSATGTAIESMFSVVGTKPTQRNFTGFGEQEGRVRAKRKRLITKKGRGTWRRKLANKKRMNANMANLNEIMRLKNIGSDAQAVRYLSRLEENRTLASKYGDAQMFKVVKRTKRFRQGVYLIPKSSKPGVRPRKDSAATERVGVELDTIQVAPKNRNSLQPKQNRWLRRSTHRYLKSTKAKQRYYNNVKGQVDFLKKFKKR